MEYAEDNSMTQKAQHLQGYSFIEKPQIQQDFIDSEEDILGLKLFNWSKIE